MRAWDTAAIMCYNIIGDVPLFCRLEVVDVSTERPPIDADDLVRRYLSGESENALSRRYGVSRTVITRILRETETPRRGQTEANRILQASRTPEQRRAYTTAAHIARRGNKDPIERREQRAATRERRQLGVSPAEMLLCKWLQERGITMTPQKAIGPYNVDLGTDTIAVEIFGGGWHAYGRHRTRAPERYRYLLDRGINIVIIWVGDGRRMPQLLPATADYIATFYQLASNNPAVRGEYRVIWGDGKMMPASRVNLDNLSDIPSRRAANRTRA